MGGATGESELKEQVPTDRESKSTQDPQEMEWSPQSYIRQNRSVSIPKSEKMPICAMQYTKSL